MLSHLRRSRGRKAGSNGCNALARAATHRAARAFIEPLECRVLLTVATGLPERTSLLGGDVGTSVAVSTSNWVTGAPGANDRGAAGLYDISTGTGTQLDNPRGTLFVGFGYSVAISD